jgi:ABC-type uncharacterized transport system permease subunit
MAFLAGFTLAFRFNAGSEGAAPAGADVELVFQVLTDDAPELLAMLALIRCP